MVQEPTRPPPHAPAPHGAPVPTTGTLPAGLYDVTEIVEFDTCHPTRGLPPRVTIVKRHRDGRPSINLPLPGFGFENRSIKRVESSLYGYSGSGMSHPKVCPGPQQTFKEELFDVTPTSFRVSVDYEVADGWDCPNPRPQPLCRTRLVYEYRLATALCDAHCEGSVPGLRDHDVPPGPVPLACNCG